MQQTHDSGQKKDDDAVMDEQEIRLEGEIAGGSLSFSKIKTFMLCGYKFYYQYVQKLKWAPPAKMILGRAFHSGQEYGIKQMLERSTPPADMVTEFSAAAYEDELKAEPVIEYDEKDPNQHIVKDDLAKMSGPVFEREVSKLAPLSAERSFEVDVAGTRVRGRLDEEDKVDDGVCVTELKTGARNPEALTAFDWQQSIYQLSQPLVKRLRKIFTKRHMDVARNISVTVYEKQPDPPSLTADIVTGIGRIAEAIKSASIHGFVKTPDLRVCAWCGFRKPCRPEIFGHEDQIEQYVTSKVVFSTKADKGDRNGNDDPKVADRKTAHATRKAEHGARAHGNQEGRFSEVRATHHESGQGNPPRPDHVPEEPQAA